MKYLELLAPAKNIEIGIAAIDCGADAVYIAGPAFGARQAAGNSMEDIARLCTYAHRYGARIFLTLNTILYDNELEDAYRTMCLAEDAGVDAIIVQDLAVRKMADGGPDGKGRRIMLPLHASTQCAIRNSEKAMFYKNAGFSRLVLEREISLADIADISNATGCEIEFFVHGALCVCYSGQCYMSEHIAGRSANRGECIQACRSKYDLLDNSGHTILKNKALLSLKDYNLLNRLEDLAEAGVTSFKIEGRLKNISYVKNTVRAYSEAIDRLIASHPDKYARASFGRVTGGFQPDLNKTFNRGYTELFLDGKRGKWSSMDTAKGTGENLGTIRSVRSVGHNEMEIQIAFSKSSDGLPSLQNGDGFATINSHGDVVGFRGDICSGTSVICKRIPELKPGTPIFRNISTAFEKTLEANVCHRYIRTSTDISVSGSENAGFCITATATTEDGRSVSTSEDAGKTAAENAARMSGLLESQFTKSSNHYQFCLSTLKLETEDGKFPFVSAAFLNGIRRALAEMLDNIPVGERPMMNIRKSSPADQKHTLTVQESIPKHLDYSFNISNRLSREMYLSHGADSAAPAYEISHSPEAELMRTKYCIRHELGLCPKQGKVLRSDPMQLRNNGQIFMLKFDCRRCEMTVTSQGTKK